MAKEEILKKVNELLEAKESVLFCLNNPTGLAGMHGIGYWGGRVEDLREQLAEVL